MADTCVILVIGCWLRVAGLLAFKKMWVFLLAVGVVSVVGDVDIPLRCREERCRYIGIFQFDEHRYEVDGHQLSIIYWKADGFLWIKCAQASVLESRVMPRGDSALTAWKVVVRNCQLPAVGSLGDKLTWLNISMLYDDTDDASEPRGNLTIESLPSGSLLTAKHLVGLDRLICLEIKANSDARLRAEHNFLSPLQRLRSLRLEYVTVSSGELDTPRPTLLELKLIYTGVERLPEAVHSSTSLLDLKIESDTALDAVAVPPKLRFLDLQSPATTLRVDAIPALEKLEVTNWTETQPLPLTRCDNLVKLYLTAPAVHTLPYGWLAICSSLEELVIQKAKNLTSLPQRLFGSNYSDLTRVAFKEGALETLSEGQFGDECELLTLELNGNRLQTIPSGTLCLSLEKLDLSSNDLDGSVMDVVATVQYRLFELNLSNNPRLNVVCDKEGYSPIRPVDKLSRLFLNKTNVTRLCRDWREGMPFLKMLDLRQTSVTALTFKDLQFKQTVRAVVLLQGAPVSLLEMTRDDLDKAKRTPTSGAFIHLDATSRLQCDCRMYWTRRVLERFPHALERISTLRCVGGRLLQELLHNDMVCARPKECKAAALPTACTCFERPDDNPAWDRKLIRVSCEHAALGHVPRFSTSKERLYELHLAHNHISNLEVSDLQNIKGLDLRHNFIRRVDEKTAKSLNSISGILRLDGNPLECDCTAAPLLQALNTRSLRSNEQDNVICRDGTTLIDAPVVECSPSITWLVVGFAALFAVAVTIIAFLVSGERRFFLKAVLHRWGCLWCVETYEDERLYDAFVTFSHMDEEVVRELVARLEPPYRLCLHYRDWIPGLRIPDQIIESVRESHRTVALVSRHFLASSWARVEFREAHEAAMLDARPRLIVILLEEPSALPLDEQLQRYISTHTYLRWGDPWFYNKLAVALPRPRRPEAVMDIAPFGPSTYRTLSPTVAFTADLEDKPTNVQTSVDVPVSLSAIAMFSAMKLYAAPRPAQSH